MRESEEKSKPYLFLSPPILSSSHFPRKIQSFLAGDSRIPIGISSFSWMEDKNRPPPESDTGWRFPGDGGPGISSLDDFCAGEEEEETIILRDLCAGEEEEETVILRELGWSIPMDTSPIGEDGGFPGFGLDDTPGPSAKPEEPPEARSDAPAAALPARSGDAAASSSSSGELPPEPDEKPADTA